MAKRSSKYIVWAIVILVIGGLVFIKVRASGKKKKAPAPTTGQAPPIPVKGYIVKTQRIENLVVSTGTVLANEEIVVQPEVAGRITQILFKEGTSVAKGNVLVKLFDADLQAQLRKLVLQEELAIKNEQRLKELLSIDAVSQQEYDVAFNQLSTIRADMDLINAGIQKTEIRAPFSGKVGLRNVSVGAYVSPGTVITTLQQVQPVRIDFSIPEKYLPLINSRSDIEFSVEGVDETFTAPVIAVEPRIDENSRTVRIRALYDNKQLKVFPGAFAKINLPLQEIESGIMIPTESVIPGLKGQKVYLSREGKAFPQPVVIGMRNDSTVQVLEGLKPGDTVITTGILQLRPQSPLKIISVK